MRLAQVERSIHFSLECTFLVYVIKGKARRCSVKSGLFRFICVAILTLSITATGCSVFMAGSRSTYKDTSVIQVGADRDVVINEVGHPDSSLKMENGGYKDIYKIDPDAHRAGSRGAAVAGHLVADILTLGLWEIVGTPLELAAQDDLTTFILKYDASGKLLEVETIK
ncbi:hypothetical protein MYX04_04230 [Nitrospiraceae bacterium AH_259_D15_M11_P09]|nr:hypothetical protein [Nitrospiraceae bacterium AH_259_D15_M11_P09]